MTVNRTCDATDRQTAESRYQPEEIFDPSRRIVDCHHHLEVQPLTQGNDIYFLDDLTRDITDGHLIEATVYIEDHSHYRTDGPEHLRPVGETEFANGQAEEAARRCVNARVCAAIVSHANLDLGDAVEEVLLAHQEAAPDRFRGIRDILCPNPLRGEYTDERHRLLNPNYRAGLATVGRLGLSAEAMIFDFQLPDLIETARALPDLPIVLNHLGGVIVIGPYKDKREEKFVKWSADIAELAKCENVLVKLGGMNMFITGFGWDPADPPSSDELVAATGRYFHHAIDQFGPDRCMFESNFPIDAAGGPYRTLWNSFKKIASRYTEDEKNAMFSGTAKRHYKIG
jgi:predicted TIM-barrel fold metal-dependent hydrolase